MKPRLRTTATNNTAIGNAAMEGSSAAPKLTGNYNVALGESRPWTIYGTAQGMPRDQEHGR